MKVILTKDVKGQGKSGDVINVSDGYANNFLIKKGLAVLANNENMNVLNNKIKAEEHRREVEYENAKETDKKLSGKDITIVFVPEIGKFRFEKLPLDALIERMKDI